MIRIIIFTIILCSNCYAQDILGTNILTNNPNYDDKPRSVLIHSDGYYYSAGFHVHGGIGNENILLIKYDADLDTVWARTFNGAGDDDRGYSVCETADGNIVVAGYTTHTGGSKLGFLLKVNASTGDSLWMQTYGSTSYDNWFRCVSFEASDSGFAVCGSSESYFGGGNKDFWIIRTDSLGDTLWTKSLNPGGSNGVDHLQQIIPTSSGHYLTSGYSGSPDFTDADASNDRPDGVLLKLDKSDGDTLWLRHYGDSYRYWSEVYGCIESLDGSCYYICGGINHFDILCFTAFVAKIDTLGNTVWFTEIPKNRNIHSFKNDYLMSLVQMENDSSLFCVGSCRTENYNQRYHQDLLVVNVDKNGNTVYVANYGTDGNGEQATSVKAINSTTALCVANYNHNPSTGADPWILIFNTMPKTFIGVSP